MEYNVKVSIKTYCFQRDWISMCNTSESITAVSDAVHQCVLFILSTIHKIIDSIFLFLIATIIENYLRKRLDWSFPAGPVKNCHIVTGGGEMTIVLNTKGTILRLQLPLSK